MNIFAVHEHPGVAARSLPDKLVIKMPTEAIQMLTPWAFHTHDFATWKPDGTQYSTKGYANHPCSKWLYESDANVMWLLEHALEMSQEYTRRYNKQHGINYALEQVANLTRNWMPGISCDHTEFVQAMPAEFRVPGDPVTAYRNYIIGYKGYAEWRYSEKPDWWDETKHEPVRKKYLAEREEKRIERANAKHQKLSRGLQD